MTGVFRPKWKTKPACKEQVLARVSSHIATETRLPYGGESRCFNSFSTLSISPLMLGYPSSYYYLLRILNIGKPYFHWMLWTTVLKIRMRLIHRGVPKTTLFYEIKIEYELDLINTRLKRKFEYIPEKIKTEIKKNLKDFIHQPIYIYWNKNKKNNSNLYTSNSLN